MIQQASTRSQHPTVSLTTLNIIYFVSILLIHFINWTIIVCCHSYALPCTKVLCVPLSQSFHSRCNWLHCRREMMPNFISEMYLRVPFWTYHIVLNKSTLLRRCAFSYKVGTMLLLLVAAFTFHIAVAKCASLNFQHQFGIGAAHPTKSNCVFLLVRLAV